MGLTKAQLEALNDSSFPNNNGGLITPQILRDYNDAAIANTVNQDVYTADSASFNSRINTGSLLVTASFNNGTRNLTFTKGDASTFNVNIPDVSGSTLPSGLLSSSVTNFVDYSASVDARILAITGSGGDVTALNAFTASQLVINSGYNTFTQSTNTSLSNLNSATASYVTETESGSFLLTASFDNGTRNLTFTKGNNTTFAVNIPDVSGSTGNFATTGSNTFTGIQTINDELILTGSKYFRIGAGQAISSGIVGGGLTIESQGGNLIRNLAGGGDITLQNTQGNVIISGSSTQIQEVDFIPFSASLNTRINAATINTASFATTGSNVFTGDQTLIDAGGNTITLSDTSGSLMLVAKTFTSASAHLSSSISPKVNLIFKDNSNTADTIISGSSNIFPNPITPGAGLKRYVGGNNNIYTSTGIPQLSGSMQFSPSMNRNIGSFGAFMRGPVSSSAWNINDNFVGGGVVNLGTAAAPMEKMAAGFNFNSNLLMGGTFTQTATGSLLDTSPIVNSNIVFGAALTLNHNASALSYFSNIQNGGITINNNYIPTVGSTLSRRGVFASINTVYGISHKVDIAGSNTSTTLVRNLTANLLAGTYITASLQDTGDNTSMIATNMMGNALIVSGTSASPAGNPIADATYGSVFTGRFNATDGNKAKTAETIFAVGTGTSYANRKTGFLIDSGSNTFVEGTLNVSGSLLLNGTAVGGIATGSFATTGSNAFNGNQTITGSVSIRGNTTFTSVSGDQSSVILGNEALATSVGGNINVAIGNSAMKNASGSSQNVAVGNRALFKTTGSFNIAIGSETLTENTTGTNNVAIGLNALNLNTTGGENFALGSNSMMFTSGSSATSNVAIGVDTLTRNQVDSQIAIGANALQRATTGNANTAIGRFALTNTTTGFDNVAIGTNALYSNVTGTRNIAIGKESLRNAAANGDYNIGIGWDTLYNAKSSNNVAIGLAAFENLQSGSDNVGIGHRVGNSVTTGYYNTLIGANLLGQSDWSNVVAISDGQANIKFFNSGSRTTITNNTLISGSLTTTGSLTIQSGSSFFANGNKQFNIGAFQSNVSQSGSAGVSQSMNFEVTDISEGVTIASNSRITLANSGTYNIQFSAQILADAGADDVYIWLKKNGVNVTASAGHVTLANNEELIAAWNYVVNAAANDYFEIAWQSTNGDALLLTETATGNIPSVPSIILTVTQVR